MKQRFFSIQPAFVSFDLSWTNILNFVMILYKILLFFF